MQEKSDFIMFDLVTVGHFTVDQIVINGTKYEHTLGGPPTYSSLAARKVGSNVAVVSKVGEDFPKAYLDFLNDSGVNLAGLKFVKGYPTTHFTLKYRGEERTVQLSRRCEPIYPEDIPAMLKSKAIHVGPVAGEVSIETLSCLSKITELISLDPQGFVRHFDGTGVAKLSSLSISVLDEIKIFKSSESELMAAMGIDDVIKAVKKAMDHGLNIVLVTRGSHGASLFQDNIRYEIPSYKPPRIVDYTGAGDAFIGAFMAEYVKKESPVWCAAVGSAASSFVIEGLGPSRFGERGEVFERANEIYKKVKKNEF